MACVGLGGRGSRRRKQPKTDCACRAQFGRPAFHFRSMFALPQRADMVRRLRLVQSATNRRGTSSNAMPPIAVLEKRTIIRHRSELRQALRSLLRNPVNRAVLVLRFKGEIRKVRCWKRRRPKSPPSPARSPTAPHWPWRHQARRPAPCRGGRRRPGRRVLRRRRGPGRRR